MLGIGRFGGIAGSFRVAELAQRQTLSFGQIFATVAIPGVIAALALVVKQAARPEDKTAKLPEAAAVPIH